MYIATLLFIICLAVVLVLVLRGQVFVLVLVRGGQVLVLVLVFGGQVLVMVLGGQVLVNIPAISSIGVLENMRLTRSQNAFQLA